MKIEHGQPAAPAAASNRLNTIPMRMFHGVTTRSVLLLVPYIVPVFFVAIEMSGHCLQKEIVPQPCAIDADLSAAPTSSSSQALQQQRVRVQQPSTPRTTCKRVMISARRLALGDAAGAAAGFGGRSGLALGSRGRGRHWPSAVQTQALLPSYLLPQQLLLQVQSQLLLGLGLPSVLQLHLFEPSSTHYCLTASATGTGASGSGSL